MAVKRKPLHRIYKSASLVIISAVICLTSASLPVSAFDAFHQQNDILFSGEGDGDTTCAAIKTFNGSLPPATVQMLESQNVKASAEANMARYTHAAAQTGVPWQIAAGIHYREARMNPNSSMLDGSSLSAGTSKDGLPIDSNPNNDAANAMNHLIKTGQSVYGLDNGAIASWNLKSWAEAVTAYSRGFMYKDVDASYETSPYAMNYIDDARQNMAWQRADSYYKGKRLNGLFDSGQRDSNLGAIVVATYLGMSFTGTTGGTGGSTNCSGPGAVTGDVVETAVRLSWADRTHKPNDPKPEYREAIEQAKLTGAGCSSNGADCGVFVATVMRVSGADPEFPVGTSVIQSYLRENAKYTKVEATDTSGLVPGDIFIIPGHTFMYVGESATDGGKNMASASCSVRTADRGYDVYFSDFRGKYEIFRKT